MGKYEILQSFAIFTKFSGFISNGLFIFGYVTKTRYLLTY